MNSVGIKYFRADVNLSSATLQCTQKQLLSSGAEWVQKSWAGAGQAVAIFRQTDAIKFPKFLKCGIS